MSKYIAIFDYSWSRKVGAVAVVPVGSKYVRRSIARQLAKFNIFHCPIDEYSPMGHIRLYRCSAPLHARWLPQ